MALSRLLLLLALSLGQAASSVDDLPDARRYCIIGAGPGGLQIGQFMHHRGRDYVTLERRDRAATFFDKYPRHRRLISINKRYTGRDNANFNMRHDWNSLLESEVPQMTTRTKERFPPADVLAEYLRDFATVQEEAGRIVYGVTVDEVARDADGEGFVLSVLGANSESPTEAAQIACEVVISCTGVGSANVPPNLDVPGAIGYDDLPAAEETERVFENKSIVVFGMGNAGMETSKALMPYAQYVHVFGGSKYKEHPLTSWEARYPGAIRATNAEIFDAYLLKSLDGGLADGNAGVYAKGAAVRRCGPGKSQFCLMNTKAVELANGTTFNAIVIPTFPTADARSVQFYQSIQRYIVDQKIGYRQDVELDLRGPDGIVVTASAHNTEAVSSLALPEAITEENIDEFVEVSKRQGRSYPHVYDHLIRCLGWSINKEMYSPQTLPQMQPNGKFPALTAEWESVNVKNLYFAGAASHGRDHKRAAGGFIHGFRYTARAMFTVLEEKYEAQPWPQQKFEVGAVSAQKDLQVVTEALLHRINTGDGPYPMTAVIGDGILLNCGEEGEEGEGSSDTMEMDYHFNVPIAAFHNKYETRPRIVFSFGYGDGQQRTLTESIQGGSLYEVMLWFYNGELGSDGYRKKTLVRLLEALHVNWDTFNTKVAVHQFLKDKVRMICGTDFMSKEAVGDLHLMQPKQRQSVEWGPGEVINWVHNTRRSKLEIQCQLQRNAAAEEPAADDAAHGPALKLHWESCGSIEPGAGLRFRVNDGDVFKAIEGGQVIESWTADVSRGVVHDIFVGGVREKKGTRKKAKKKGKDKQKEKKAKSVLDLL